MMRNCNRRNYGKKWKKKPKQKGRKSLRRKDTATSSKDTKKGTATLPLPPPLMKDLTSDMYDYDELGWFTFGYGGRAEAYPHDRLLTRAIYARWSKNDEVGYQYLADAYNEFVRKEDEAPVRAPPTRT